MIPASSISVTARYLRQILADNRAQLVAQNRLEEGNSKEEAEEEIDTLLRQIGLFRDSVLRLTTEKGRLRIDWEVNLVGN